MHLFFIASSPPVWRSRAGLFAGCGQAGRVTPLHGIPLWIFSHIVRPHHPSSPLKAEGAVQHIPDKHLIFHIFICSLINNVCEWIISITTSILFQPNLNEYAK